MERFEGRVAVVTGASGGIGRQVAVDLVNAGLVVVGVARRKERLAELATSLQGAKGKLRPVQADLSVLEEVQRVFNWIDENLGGVSVLVNNAALLTTDTVAKVDPKFVAQLVSTNLTAVMVCSQEAIKSMQKHNITDGHIININSVAGHVIHPSEGTESWALYTSTKFGITGFSKALRFDLQKMPGFKIRTTSISPGDVATDMLPDEYLKNHANLTLKAENVSNAVLYVLSCPPNVEISELTIQPTGEAY